MRYISYITYSNAPGTVLLHTNIKGQPAILLTILIGHIVTQLK